MEALVLIFAEIIIACLAPVFAAIGAFIGLLFELLLLLFGGRFARFVEKRRKMRAQAKGKAFELRKPLIPRKVVHWVAGASAVAGVAGVAASYIFFQPILRHVLDVASETAGMSVDYGRASGSLLGGHVVLQGLEMRRVHDTGLAFDLEIERAEVDVSLWSLIDGPPTLALGHVFGMTGQITPPLQNEKKKGLPKPRKAFRADLFSAQDVDLQITPRGEEPFAVVIDSARVAPFRSGLAVFDLLFRSNMKAEIAGQSMLVETRKLGENGRETRWAFEDVDAAQLQRILPKAPLTWIDEGRITATVSDQWSLEDDFVDMDWRIATVDMQMSVPSQAGRAERVLAKGLGAYVNRFGGDVDFRYQLALDPEEVAALREGNLDQFWQMVLSGIMKGAVSKAEAKGAAVDIVEDEKPGAIDRLKSIFKKDEPTE